MIQAAPDIDARIGARIRILRGEKGLSLEGLARLADVSRAMLSRVERGESSPTAQLLNKICGGLDTTLSTLFAEPEAPVSPLSRRADQPSWRDPGSQYLRRHVSPMGTGSPVEIVEVTFPAGGRVAFDRQLRGGTDQHVWVLEGVLELDVGDVHHRLEAGDCLMMRLDQPVRFHNPGSAPVRYAVILCHGASTS
jgi:transcriptional regulator with XRE-family HTH domain